MEGTEQVVQRRVGIASERLQAGRVVDVGDGGQGGTGLFELLEAGCGMPVFIVGNPVLFE